MNALADKAHKQGMPRTHMHSITQPHYSTFIPTEVAVHLLPTGVPLGKPCCSYQVIIEIFHVEKAWREHRWTNANNIVVSKLAFDKYIPALISMFHL